MHLTFIAGTCYVTGVLSLLMLQDVLLAVLCQLTKLSVIP